MRTILLSIVFILVSLSVIKTNLKSPTRSTKVDVLRLIDISAFERALAATTIDPNSLNMSNASGRADFARFLYMMVNGPIMDANGTVEYQISDGPGSDTTTTDDDGLIGMIRHILGPDALGAGLSANGITSCETIPTSGSVSMTDSEGTYVMSFAASSKTIPTGFVNAGSSFDNRVNISFNGTAFMNVELDCGMTKSGWIRANFDESGTNRGFETYFQSNSLTGLVQLDFYMVYPVSGNDERMAVRFSTSDADSFSLYLIRTVDAASDESASVAVTGVASTGKAQMKYIFPNASYLTNTDAVTASENGTTIHEECLSLVSNGVTTGCASTAATGTLVLGGGNWVINSVSSLSLSTIE